MSHAFELLQVIHDFAIRELSIFASQKYCVELRLRFENYLDKATISYKDKEDDTLIEVTEYNKRLVKDKNYIDVACEDMLNILSEAKFAENLHLQNLYAYYDEDAVLAVNRVYKQFKIHSQTTKNPIYVHSLNFQFLNVSQLRSLLTYFNPTKLKKLGITCLKRSEEIFDFRSIVEMDHWKNAKRIKLYCFSVNIPFGNFSHCEDVVMGVSSISADDIQTLVNIVSNSSFVKCFYITYNCLHENVTEKFLDTVIGEKKINKFGYPFRLIGNEFMLVLISSLKTISIYKLPDKKKERNIETPEPLTRLATKSAMLCLSNRLIMEKIVKHFDFAELVVLRRIFRGSRRCVDLLKPDPKLVAMKISVEPGFICVEIFVQPHLFYPIIDINNLSDDLVQLLKDQKTALEEFCVTLDSSCKRDSDYAKIKDWELTVDHFIEMFTETYSLRGFVFPVEKLNLKTTRLKQAARILQNMDPLLIKSIEFRSMTHWIITGLTGILYLDWTELGPHWTGLGPHIEELVCLEQWKSARELKIEHFSVQCDIQKLIHFSKVDVRLESISLEGVLYLKEKFLSSSNFLQFKTKFVETDVDDSIFKDNFLGAPFRRVGDISSGQPNIWFFPYADVKDDLQVRYYQKHKVFMFIRVSRR